MTLSQAVLLSVVAGAGGALNSVAGGGTFLTFPALLLTGVPAVPANATCTFALWPGSVASAYAYRHDVDAPRKLLVLLACTSLVGGAFGAWLLLHTPNKAFEKVIPFLLLFASLVFSFSGVVNQFLRRRWASSVSLQPTALISGALVQLAISLYGGYFGAGIGILMIAAWSALGFGNIHGVNGLRTLMGSAINGVALLMFVTSHAVAYGPGFLMAVCTMTTGYFGARYARRLPPLLVRRIVLAIAWTMTTYFFWKFYA